MDTRIRHDQSRSRYEVSVDGQVVGVSQYDARGDVVVFTHTEIDPELRGRGLGERLVRAALDDVRATGRTVKARCPFVARFMRNHPEYADLAA